VIRIAWALLASLGTALVVAGCGVSLSPTPNVPPDVIRLIDAIDKGNTGTLKALLDGGADPTPSGSPLSTLHAAITHFDNGGLVCDAGALRLLLAHRADPDFVDRDSGFAPLEEALAMGDIDCVSLLKEAGAGVEKHGLSGQSILQFAVKGAVRNGDVSILKLVLSWGVDVNVLSDGRRWTALFEAAATPGAEYVVKELLRLGANPCVRDSEGSTALDLAQARRTPSPEAVGLLSSAMHICPSAAVIH
jgi:ankyrin repeat protein